MERVIEHDEHADGIGGIVGNEAYTHAEVQGLDYCRLESERIRVKNEAAIAACKAEIGMLQDEEQRLLELIRQAPAEADATKRRQKRIFYRCLAGVLLVGIFCLTIYGLLPFRLGMLLFCICLAISILVPFLLDETVDIWESPGHGLMPKVVVTTLCVLGIAAMILLGIIRGEVMRQQMSVADAPAVVLDEGSANASTEQQPNFYERTGWYFALFLPLLSLAMELGAGWALWKARCHARDGREDPEELRRKLREVRATMIERLTMLKGLEAEPIEYEKRYQREFVRSVLKRARQSAGLNVLVFLLLPAALLAGQQRVLAQNRLNLVAAVDLSASVSGAQTLDGKTELDRNLSAVSRLLTSLPGGTKVTVIGITDQSFSQPYVLLSGEIGTDEGYFKERIAAARQTLLLAWQKRRAQLVSKFQQTDIFGSLVLASQVFQSDAGRRNVLVMFSDMRETKSLNFNTNTPILLNSALKQVELKHLTTDLKGVRVYALGVDGAQKDVVYWQRLREFWTEYFKKTGSDLRAYSMLRDTPAWGQ